VLRGVAADDHRRTEGASGDLHGGRAGQQAAEPAQAAAAEDHEFGVPGLVDQSRHGRCRLESGDDGQAGSGLLSFGASRLQPQPAAVAQRGLQRMHVHHAGCVAGKHLDRVHQAQAGLSPPGLRGGPADSAQCAVRPVDPDDNLMTRHVLISESFEQ
jgi:hypothetical protein